jgi:hypothetical protein
VKGVFSHFSLSLLLVTFTSYLYLVAFLMRLYFSWHRTPFFFPSLPQRGQCERRLGTERIMMLFIVP